MDIMFVHGAFVTGRCWDSLSGYFAARGHHTSAPDWPGKEAGIEVLRRDPSALRGLGITQIVDSYARRIEAMPSAPVLIGHSFGALFTQLLLDRGLGRAGVAICPAPPKGVFSYSPSVLRAFSRVLFNPARLRGIVPMSVQQFHFAFCNTMSLEETRRVHDEQVTPETGRIFFQNGLANLTPRASTRLDYAKPDRAPLLVIGAERDHVTPAGTARANYRRAKRSPARTDYREFAGRSHWIIAQAGWEEVAAFIDGWLATLP
jgi:pimeloyl-ACP methyl ester carboxylesterase